MSQEVLFSSFNIDLIDAFQNIVICKDCGAVFRNPIVPELNRVHYQTPGSWEGEDNHREHEARLDFVSGYISQRVELKEGDLYIDIGGGPGWLVGKMKSLYPHGRIVLCEPGAENCKYAKSRYPELIAIPSRIDELVVGDGAFSLITATGVDYLFIEHRAALEKIARMMRDDGFFYIERAVFVEQESYYRHPIFDHDDLFGHNHMMNFWPGRQQFIAYISEFFDVVDKIDYNWVETLGHKCQCLGLLCKKKRNDDSDQSIVTNFYLQHVNELIQRAPLSSLEDLKVLAKKGVKRVTISGDRREATALRLLIEKSELFSIEQLLTMDLPGQDDFVALETATPRPCDAVLVASVSSQQKYCDKLQSGGFRAPILPCFRYGYPHFEAITSTGTTLQMKAFLPAYIAGYRT